MYNISIFLLHFNCCNLTKFRLILKHFSVLLRKHEVFCILPNHSIVCSPRKFPRLCLLNYAFSVPWLLEVVQLIFPSLSWNAPFCDITMGCKRFNLKLGENLWKNINIFIYEYEERITSKQLCLYKNHVVWDTYNTSHNFISVNMLLGGLYTVNTRAFWRYMTWWFLPTRNIQIYWQAWHSCWLADPVHKRGRYCTEVCFPLHLGELLEVMDNTCLIFAFIVLNTVLAFNKEKVGNTDAAVFSTRKYSFHWEHLEIW